MGTDQKYIYILFSATPYRMGRIIRFVTGEPFNHVAIATEEDLHEMYAFARRYYRTPFYGGFVAERPYRYHHNGDTAEILVCRLPLTQRQWDRLQALLEEMKANPDHYLYNHLSILLAPLHRKVRVQDAFTCAEFVVTVLHTLGFAFDPDRFYTIGDIARKLNGHEVYRGAFPEEADDGAAFFSPRPLPHTLYATTKSFMALLWRKVFA